MLLSSMNFVNNSKFSDFILDKITEEQAERDAAMKRLLKRHSFHGPTAKKEVDFTFSRRSAMRERRNSGGTVSKSSTLSSQTSTSTASTLQPDDVTATLVTIETTDQYAISAHPYSQHISLKKRQDVNENAVFRKLDFGPDETGKGQLTVFQLHSNPSYYLATTRLRHLELQSYCDDTLDEDDPDERFFCLFHSQFGVDLLQPYAHKGFYIHHIDNFINIRQLELNFRPPEEYFLNFGVLTEEEARALTSSQAEKFTFEQEQNKQSEQNSANKDDSAKQVQTNTPLKLAIPDISKNSLKRKDSKKLKEKSPITPRHNMLACFGLGMKKKNKKDKTKR